MDGDGLTRFPLPRRGVVMSGLMTGLTLATTRVEAQAIHTPEQGIAAGEARIPTRDGALPAYFAKPEGAGPFPVVLVIEEIFGVHEYIKDICRRLAHAGYLAVAAEYYARVGDLSKMTDVQQIIRDVISKTPDDQLLSDLDATASWAATQGGTADRMAVTGWCRGGRNTWLYAAHNPHLKAAVAWYGPVEGQTSAIQPRTAMDVANELKCPLLGLYGAQDQSIPVEAVHRAEAKAKAAGRTVEIMVYRDAGHGFHADYRPSYNKRDAEDGWARMLGWFRQAGV